MNTASESIASPAQAAWETPQCPFRIEFPPAMLEEIRAAAVEAYYSVPRGGVEIGGVLFGGMDSESVRIESWKPIRCEYALGPSFTLSESDRAALAESLDNEKGEVVGWFHSHTRSEIHLSAADLELYERFFPGKRQVALVVRPAHLQPSRAGFFFREKNGRVRGEGAYREFVIDAASMAEMTIREQPAASPTASLPMAPGKRRGNFGIPAVVCAALALAGAFATREHWCAAAPAAQQAPVRVESQMIEELEKETERIRAQLLDEKLRNQRLERSVRFLRERASGKLHQR